MYWKGGDIITLSCSSQPNWNIQFIIDEKQKSVYTFANPDHPYSRLRMKHNGDIDFFPQVGKNSLFAIEEKSDGYIAIRSISSKVGDEAMYVGIDKTGALVGTAFDTNSVETVFVLSSVNELKVPSINTPCSNILEQWQLRRFMFDGFLHVPAAVCMTAVFNCQQLLMNRLGVPGVLTPGGTQPGFGKIGGSVSNCSEVRALLEPPSQIVRIVEELFGCGSHSIAALHDASAQIALRFPERIPHRNTLTASKVTSPTSGEFFTV